MKYYITLFLIIYLICINHAYSIQTEKNIEDLNVKLFFVNLKKDDYLQDIHAKLNKIAQELKIYNQENIDFWIKEYKILILQSIISEGYFDAEIDYKWNTEKKELLFILNPGDRYKIDQYTISGNVDLNIPEWNLNIKDKYISTNIINISTNRIFDVIDKNFSFLNIDINHEITLNYANKTLNIEFTYYVANPTYIKNLKINGLDNVSESQILSLLGFTSNQKFHYFIVDEFVKKLNNMNLFNNIIPHIPQNIDQDGSISIQIDLKEQKKKRFYSSFNYNISSQKFDTTLGYILNNIRSTGQSLGISAQFDDTMLPTVFIDYRLPIFQNLALLFNTRLGKTQYDKFTISNNAITLGIKKYLPKNKVDNLFMINYSAFKENTNKNAKNDILYHKKLEKEFLYIGTLYQLFYFNNQKFLEKLLIEVNILINCHNLQNSFMKTYFLMNYLFKIKNTILKTKFSLINIIKSFDAQIPIVHFIMLGEDNFARGYNNALNKKEITLPDIRQYNENIHSFNLSLDLIIPKTSKNIDIGIFYDLTYVGQYNLKFKNNIYNSIGASVIYKKLSLPLKIEIAFPLNKRDKIDSMMSFSLGMSF